MDEKRLNNNKLSKMDSLFFGALYKKILSYDQVFNTIQPIINFGFFNDISTSEMYYITITDNSGILYFIKSIPQKTQNPKSTTKTIRHVGYVIAKKFCNYYHYDTGKVINDNIFELYNLEPDFIKENVIFAYDDEEVDPSNKEIDINKIKCYYNYDSDELIEMEPKISELNKKDISMYVGYYINSENIKYVHVFSKELSEYYIRNENDTISGLPDYNILQDALDDYYSQYEDLFENEDEDINNTILEFLDSSTENFIELLKNQDTLDVGINLLLSNISNDMSKKSTLNSQEISINISIYFSQVLLPLILGEY